MGCRNILLEWPETLGLSTGVGGQWGTCRAAVQSGCVKTTSLADSANNGSRPFQLESQDGSDHDSWDVLLAWGRAKKGTTRNSACESFPRRSAEAWYFPNWCWKQWSLSGLYIADQESRDQCRMKQQVVRMLLHKLVPRRLRILSIGQVGKTSVLLWQLHTQEKHGMSAPGSSLSCLAFLITLTKCVRSILIFVCLLGE